MENTVEITKLKLCKCIIWGELLSTKENKFVRKPKYMSNSNLIKHIVHNIFVFTYCNKKRLVSSVLSVVKGQTLCGDCGAVLRMKQIHVLWLKWQIMNVRADVVRGAKQQVKRWGEFPRATYSWCVRCPVSPCLRAALQRDELE